MRPRLTSAAILRASETRYRTLVDQIPEGIFLVDGGSLRILEANDGATALTGYTRDELVGMTISELVPPKDRAAQSARVAAIDTRSSHIARFRIRRKDASLIEIEAIQRRLDDGQILGVLRDLSERSRADRYLHEMLAGIDLFAATFDREGRIAYANPALAALTGWTTSELIGRSVFDLVPPASRDRARAGFATSANGGPMHPHQTTELMTRSGARRLVDLNTALLRDEGGEIVGAAFIGEDVTEREALRRERERLSLAVDVMPGSVILLDPEGLIVDVNPAFERMSGCSKGEVIGRHAWDVVVGEVLPPGSWGDIGATLATGRAWAGEWVLHRKDGAPYREEATINPVRDDSGKIVNFVCVARDVTREREAQTALERELRERIDVAAALGRLQPGGTAEATAATICRELHALRGVDVAVVITFGPAGEATVLAVDAPTTFPMATGDRLPAARAAYLAERALTGPWAEHWQPRAEDGVYARTMTKAGVRGAAYAPIRNGEGLLGLLTIAALSEETADYMVTHLPVVAEFGATASVLLAPELEADRRISARHSQIATIIASRAFYLVFQPIVDIEGGDVVGYEALTRFMDGARPDHRFADAWTVDLGADLELATLDAAITLARELPAARWLDVNVSPRLLDDPGRVRAMLAKADRPVIVEITEHDTVANYRALRDAIGSLGDSVRTAVDDAGAGIANFAHIVELRPDFVKLDIGLVRGVNANLGRQAIVVAMRHFARVSGCRLIAEGVETEAEAKSLAALGVDFGQGYWYGRPATADALTAELRQTPDRIGS